MASSRPPHNIDICTCPQCRIVRYNLRRWNIDKPEPDWR